MNKRNEYLKKRYHKIRLEAINLLGGKCVKCGSKELLEFDHIDPSSKTINVSKILSMSLKDFWNEVSKCQLLCKACHLLKTITERGHKVAKGAHGTESSYRHCKCILCKEAHRNYYKEYEKKYNIKRVYCANCHRRYRRKERDASCCLCKACANKQPLDKYLKV